ncbi:MAG: NUDIX hydrolase [Defluviitaleaceae bacterium]|nr:NUDIX hydrolase [Defluviitaleaceae bacterium]
MSEYIKNMRKHVGKQRMLLVGASAIPHKDGKILLQKRKDNGCWGDPGGFAELGETMEEVAKRELFEETGLIAHSLELLGVLSGEEMFYTYPNGDQVANTTISYLCEDFSGELRADMEETTDLQWFAIDDLPENISPPARPVLANCVEVLKKRN